MNKYELTATQRRVIEALRNGGSICHKPNGYILSHKQGYVTRLDGRTIDALLKRGALVEGFRGFELAEYLRSREEG